MGDVIKFVCKKALVANNEKLTPELIKEYKQTIGMVLTYQNDLSNEDWKSVFTMMINFNNLLTLQIEGLYDRK